MKYFSLLAFIIVIAIGAYIWQSQISSVSDQLAPFTNNNQQAGNTNETNQNSNGINIKDILLPLNKVDYSNQGLTKVPEGLFDQPQVQELDLSHNRLTGAIPAEIRFLQNLEILDLSDNQMTGLPAEVGQLTRLRVLDLSNNKLTGLPYELGNLSNLRTLNLSGNSYSEYDLSIILEKLPSTVQVIK